MKMKGQNVLREAKQISKWSRIIEQFRSPVVLILIGAMLITTALGDYTDSLAILFIVVINSVIGFIQETKAEEAVLALKNLSAPKAKVIDESGVVKEIPARDVCLGDRLLIEAGDYVPADCRILKAAQLFADESVLTGESLPVNKHAEEISENVSLADRNNMLFASTAVSNGTAEAIVTAIGMDTEIGKIAGLLEEAKVIKTPLQVRLEQVSKKLIFLSLAVVLVVALLGFLHQQPWLEIVMTAISLSVAAIPEGLPTVVTLTLALAVRRMSSRNAIVRNLNAVETLGSTSVICTDKTGTLTTGKMRVRDLFAYQDNINDLLISSVLCSNATLQDDGSSTGDPTEVALLYSAIDHGLNIKEINRGSTRLFEWSFDSNRKRMSVAVKNHDEVIIHVKGAPESVLALCLLTAEEKKHYELLIEQLSAQGKRLLAVGSKSITNLDVLKNENFDLVENNLHFRGLIAIADPPREETIPAIKLCKNYGIKIVMITGDHPVTAKAIATELGIVEPIHFEKVLTGSELDQMQDNELIKVVESTAVYARVSPEHKLKIIRAWQQTGHVVAMTGDGVNDAPALKQASIGVSMGRSGTEVAKQASTMILTDDNFATIVSAVEEGRAIFGNIKRTILYLLAGNFSEILIMLGAAIAGWPTPLLPLHLLWINLVTDGFPSLALAAEPISQKHDYHKRPSAKTFFDKQFYRNMLSVGLINSAMALTLYGYLIQTTDAATARTYVFSFLVFEELFRSFSSRSEKFTFFQKGILTNKYHLLAVAIPLIIQVWINHSPGMLDFFKVQPLSWTQTGLIILLTLIPVTLIEVTKIYLQKCKVQPVHKHLTS